jgi:lysophospholipid acyltransferase (LPLAT)-like uncharacterized protein
MRIISATLFCRSYGEDPGLAARKAGKGMILVGWHGTTFIPVTKYRKRGYWSMISTSRDGEYQDRIFKKLGFNTVRGSSSARGAIQSTIRIVRELKAGAVLAHTPDGPRGPWREFQQGAIFMAIRSGCDIAVVASYASPRFILSTWDHYLIPYPFARAAIVYGKPHHIPPDIDEQEQARWAEKLAEEINVLEAEAARHVGYHIEPNPTSSNSESVRLTQ